MTMANDEMWEWLRSGKVRWGRLATIGKDGFPHVVPLSFFVQGEDIIMNLRNQRWANVRRNPKVGLVIDGGRDMSDLRGATMQGTARIVDSPAEVLELTREGARRRGVAEDQLPTEPRPGMVYMRFHPSKVATWDYAKRAR